MSVIERQVHGYRQGHRLLAASASLSKEDQSVVDRLSDVAGPLRPRERFEPYLTAYPLPSGKYYVFARTWQDLTVARAGCVRTLSLIVPIDDWAQTKDLSAYLDLIGIDRLPDEADATAALVSEPLPKPLPAASEYGRSELVEALFLEDPRPVVVLDAVGPELIATRLLTALWPSLRRRFAISTFALSPRKIAGRDFNLVFAPKDARAKFADWSGSRVDGRSVQSGRHRWTNTIISRVFDEQYPRLLSPAEAELVGGAGSSKDNAAALRIALLWTELASKLASTPTAALGLLDIANSGKVLDSQAFAVIEPALATVARQASESFPDTEAWDFLGAIARKLQGRSMPDGRNAVGEAVEQLAARAPEGAIAFLSQEDPRGANGDLLSRIATGIGSTFTDRSAEALISADPALLSSLLAQGGALIANVAEDRRLVDRLGQVLTQFDTNTLEEVGGILLPLLTEDWQLAAAKPLLGRLGSTELQEELLHLGRVNDFTADQLSKLVLEKALSTTPSLEVRETLACLPNTERRNVMIAHTLTPSIEDVRWLFETEALNPGTAMAMVIALIRRADDQQFVAILADHRAVNALEAEAPELLRGAVANDQLSIEVFVRILPSVLAGLSGDEAVQIAKQGLSRLLPRHFGGDEITILASLFSMAGDKLDGAWAARIGLNKKVDALITSRNMVALRKAIQPARIRVAWSIGEVAQILADRPQFDLDAAAADACAGFLRDAEKVAPQALLTAAAYLLPVLMKSKDRPVSSMISVVFPPIHREYAKSDEITDFFRIFAFFDWDRCKAARNDLVDAFLSSSWPPHDLALTACRTNEVFRILERVAKQSGGKGYLKRISADLNRLPAGCRKPVEKALSQIRS